VHIELASAKSPFWDRKLGYGLAKLKSKSSEPQLQACAPCHSRRNPVAPGYRSGENYYDHYANALLEPETYYCDGQIRDEVYVFGSFLQSKMYREGIRCTDCHNPHTTKVKFSDNTLCTSCHTHEAAKYDTPAHHRHKADSAGASCVECHMPETPYMDVDLRRDHSLRIPRPDLSVELGTPNACTGCHLEPKNVAADKRARLEFYADWLQAARDGDNQVRDEIARVDRWAADQVRQWYGPPEPDKDRVEFAAVLSAGWKSQPDAYARLIDLAKNRRAAGIVRASATLRLGWYPTPLQMPVSKELLKDRDPQIRAAAVRNLWELPRRELLETLGPMLDDPIRYVRIEAATALAGLPDGAFTPQQREQRARSLDEYRATLMVNADLATAHMALGVLAERQSDATAAIEAYRTAMRVQPDVTGPRGNLASLLERLEKPDEANKLRAEELELLARDAQLAPRSAAVQYRYGLALYLAGREEEAEAALAIADKLEPNTADYCLGLALLYQKQKRYDEALPLAERVVELRPWDRGYQQLLMDIRRAAGTR
jgi:predicted CXXCH cytochrome family protein